MRSKFFITLCCILICLSKLKTAQSKTCSANEQCVPIKSCQKIMALLSGGFATKEVKDHIRSITCSSGRPPNICCEAKVQLPTRYECGIQNSDRIIGGEACDLTEFPWMALLSFTRSGSDRKEFLCGGTLINDRYVLTAAHCLKYKNRNGPKLVGIRLGEHDTKQDVDCVTEGYTGEVNCNDPPVDVPVEEVVIHENYNPSDSNQRNDIALIRLSQKINYTKFIRPVCLPLPTSPKYFVGQNLTAVGWGVTENFVNSNTKLKVLLPVKKNDDCNAIYTQSKVQITPKQLCAGGLVNRDACKGDSGGPLLAETQVDGFVNWELIGVVSFGPFPCGRQGWPGVYTNVAGYMDWIDSKLKP